MRRAALLVGLALALLAGRATYAQGPFADVPTDHWAYDAVNELAARGIFTGYPDGTFGGKRALTRYEFAIALQRMLQDVQRRIDAAVGKVPTPPPPVPPPQPPPPPPPPTPPEELKRLRQDVDTLRRLATEFQDTLAALGTDVDQVKRDLAALTDRVRAIEDQLKKMPKITGTATLAFLSRTVDNPEDFVGVTQLPTDIDARPLSDTDNFLEDIKPIYDIDLGITAQLSPVATARLLLNAGNYLSNGTAGRGYLAGSISEIRPVGDTGAFDVIPYYAYIDTPISAGPFGAQITVGKFGHQFTPYTLKLVDIDSYLAMDKTDDGNYPILGGRIAFKIGGVNVQAYAGRHREIRYADLSSTAGVGAVPLPSADGFLQLGNPIFVGNAQTGGPALTPVIDQSYGGRVSFRIPLRGNLGGTFIEGAGSENRDTFRRLQVFAADFKIQPFKWLGIGGEWAESEWKNRLGEETSRRQSKAKRAVDGHVDVPIGKLTLSGFYRRIGENFDAPGAWFNIGRWKNPRGLEGFGGSATYPIGRRIALNAEGAHYTIIGNRDNSVTHIKGGLNYALTSSNSIGLGVENIEYDADVGRTTTERYINIGWGHQFNPNMSFKLLYQIINFDAGAPDIAPNQDFDGAVAVTQFTVRF